MLVIGAGEHDPRTARARMVVADALVALGRHDEAIAALQLACSDLGDADASWADVRATARFGLAQTLRSLGRDPERVRELATAARGELALLEDPAAVDEVDRFLAGD